MSHISQAERERDGKKLLGGWGGTLKQQQLYSFFNHTALETGYSSSQTDSTAASNLWKGDVQVCKHVYI